MTASLLQIGHALPEQAAVGLELGLAHPGCRCALGPFEVGPHPDAVEAPGTELGEFDLQQLPSRGAKMSRISSERSITPRFHAFKAADLRWGEVVVDDDRGGVGRSTCSATSSTLPRPMRVAGTGRSRRWVTPSPTPRPHKQPRGRGPRRGDHRSPVGTRGAGRRPDGLVRPLGRLRGTAHALAPRSGRVVHRVMGCTPRGAVVSVAGTSTGRRAVTAPRSRTG